MKIEPNTTTVSAQAMSPREAEIFDAAWAMCCAIRGGGVLPLKSPAEAANEAASVLTAHLPARNASGPAMTEDQIAHMVSRFLGWKLPENFAPDGGVSFKREFNENTPHPMKHDPAGTNLFDATQAAEMVRYITAGLPPA